MIFGRKRKQAADGPDQDDQPRPGGSADEAVEDAASPAMPDGQDGEPDWDSLAEDDAASAEAADSGAVDDDEAEAEAEGADDDADDEDDANDDAPRDEWEELDASQDWRYDGPFDIDEVDLDADDVERLDFGSVILTPFDGMQLQLQVNPQTNQVQAVLVMHGQSAIEVALFAAPAHSSMMAEVRADMAQATEQAGGTMALAPGPFGTEVRRTLPVTTPDGKQGQAITRTWLAEGPKWLLRGVLMGKAGLQEGEDGPAELLYEFFCNLVVRRGEAPQVPGQLIPMTVPAALLAAAQNGQTPQEGATTPAAASAAAPSPAGKASRKGKPGR